MEYRHQEPRDSGAIEKLFVSVFTRSEGEREGALIGRLARDLLESMDRRDVFGFVAVDEKDIIGAIFFSRLTFDEPVDSFILSPVAVATEHQGEGVGQELITHGLREMRRRGVRFVMTYGDPAFYSKVGFHPVSPARIKPPFTLSQPAGWLGQSLTGDAMDSIAGRCSCVQALADPVYW